MEAFFLSGRAADVVLAVLAIEGLYLIWRGQMAAREVVAMLMPAALIVLAVRAALTQAPWEWVALFLALAFPAHLVDLRMRRKG